MSQHHHRERGSIIIYTMLTMTAMLAIGLTLGALFVSRLRAASAARSTMVALYAADSAVELCLMEARTGIDEKELILENEASFRIVSLEPGNPDITNSCAGLGSGSFGFRATGLYRGTSRTLEVNQ